MIKKFLITLCFLIPIICSANYNDIYVADIQYDWIDKNAVEKEAMISEVRDIIFEEPVQKRKNLKSLFKDRLKDKNNYENYMAASAGYKEFKGIISLHFIIKK